MARKPFYETDSEARWWFGLTGRALLAIVLVFVLVVAGSVIGIVLSTTTSNARGKAGATRQKNSTNNRVFQQQAFQQLYADYQGDLAKVKEAGLALTADTASKASADVIAMDHTDLVGIANHCISVAQDYNARSHFYLAQQFKDASLPDTLNPTACATA